MKALVKDEQVVFINGAGNGYTQDARAASIPIPDQDVSNMFYIGSKGRTFFKPADWPGKLVLYSEAMPKPLTVREEIDGIKTSIASMDSVIKS